MSEIRKTTLPDGTKVPSLGQGTWFMGENPGKSEEELRALRYGIEHGMTLLDTAEMYGEGLAEELLGEAIHGYDRESLFVVSKVYPHNAGKGRIFEACERSLRRLKTEYLDLYLLHWRGSIPYQETVECMEKLKEQGKIRRWGVSNLDTEEMEELYRVKNGSHCMVNQVLYHLGSRGIEYDLLPWMRERKMPFMAYCPMAQAGSLKRGLFHNKAVLEVADRHKASPAQIFLAFVLLQPDVIAIPKAGSLAHVKENIAAAQIELTQEEIGLLNQEFPAPTRKVWLDIV